MIGSSHSEEPIKS